MAIYNKGKASMDAQGYITGYDTKWRESLSLIRPGATLIFNTSPITFAVVAEVISDTSIRAIQTGKVEVAKSDYAILLHDSITVDGLAQDVAETLRYYQGKETQFERFIEIVKNMDPDEMGKWLDGVKAEADRAAAEAGKAHQSSLTAQAASTVSSEQADRAKRQVELAAAEVQKAKDQVGLASAEVTKAAGEVEKAKAQVTLANNASDFAQAQADNAAEAAGKSTVEADRAAAAAKKAEDLANQFDASKTLLKDNNLNDLTDKAAARRNLGVDNITSDDTETRVMTKGKDAWLSLRQADRKWGFWDEAMKSWHALGVEQGGTGAKDAAGARQNLGLDRIVQDANMTRIKSNDSKTELRIGQDDWYVYRDSQDSTAGYVELSIQGGGTGAGTAEEARENLGLDRFSQVGEQTYVYARGKSMKVYVDANGDWGAYDEGSKRTIALPVNRGGTGALTPGEARNNLGLGESHGVTFAQVDVKQWNGANGGIIASDNLNSNGQLVSQSRLYSEVQGGICKTTIHTSGNGKNNYVQINEDGHITGLSGLDVSGTVTARNIRSTNDIRAAQGTAVGLSTSSGGNKDIIIQNVTGDGNANSWINLLQGNWYNGYWQVGGIRGNGTDLDCFRIGVNNQGVDWKWWDFRNSYGGHITAGRGFKGACVQGGWNLDGEYMGAPFYADTVTSNDAGYSPVVSGGTRSTGGYDIRYSLGAISGGTTSWPRVAVHMLGDGTYHRAFEFHTSGQLTTWDSQTGIWGGSFEFQRVATSDRDLKKDIEYDDGKASFDNIMKFKPSTFVYKADKHNRVRRGVIAQDLYDIDPEYVRIIPGAPIIDPDAEPQKDGEPVVIDYHDDTLGLDNNVIMIDAALATRYIGGVVEKQQEEINKLKSEIEELKELVSSLVNK